jgi:CHAT domain
VTDAVTVLIVQAGRARDGLDLAEELRMIDQAVARSPFGGNALRLVSAPAARHEDLPRCLQLHRPTVLHLSGRGSRRHGIHFRTDDGGEAPVVPSGLRKLLTAAAPQLRLVVVNTCWSAELAHEFARAAGCAIGMTSTIPDRAAAAFAAEFYQSVGLGQPVGRALRIAQAALEMYGLDGHEVAELVARDDIDPDRLFLIPPHLMPPLDREPTKPDATPVVVRSAKQRFIALVSGDGDTAAGFQSSLMRADIQNIGLEWITPEK